MLIAEMTEKMGIKTRKKASAYVPEALEAFGKDLSRIRIPSKSSNVPKSQVISENIPEGLDALPKEDRKSIERYWGLTGGINHSKRIGKHNTNDRALIDMLNKAVEALKKMSKLEIARTYDASVDRMIDLVNLKISKDGVSYISDFESVKYLMVFFIVIDNGPKLSLEHDPMMIETNVDERHYLDEYEALKELCEQLEKLPDRSINLSLIKNLLEMFELRDLVTIRENFGIRSPEIFTSEEVQVLESLGIDVSDMIFPEKIEEIMTFGSIRSFKEKVFKYGAWEVTSKIIQGDNVEMEEFIKEIGAMCKHPDWISRIEEAKTGEQKEVVTSSGPRILDIYRIGGLEFTDPCEIDFLRTHLAGA